MKRLRIAIRDWFEIEIRGFLWIDLWYGLAGIVLLLALGAWIAVRF